MQAATSHPRRLLPHLILMTAFDGDQPIQREPEGEPWTAPARPEIYLPAYDPRLWPQPKPSLRSLLIAIALFIITAFSTLAAGVQFAAAYAVGQQPALEDFAVSYFQPFVQPRLFLLGIPFAATLMGILLAHELGHYFACRYYRIHATYPYFIPAPTLIGTLGAFIRIRSPIVNRRALFDVAIAGPVVGFLVAVPAFALAVAKSKFVFAGNQEALVVFGRPLIERVLEALLRPGVPHETLLLHPIGRAAWVGIFATALNLLPAGQLDGGHILYALASERHRRVTLAVAILLVPLAIHYWVGWLMWAVLLLAIGFRHPPLIDRWEPLDRHRRSWALVALAIFILCFMPTPLAV
jgi:membrane-associated protease RseP (regulator of RpoE activity)